MEIPQMTAQALAARMAADPELVLLDVRTPQERVHASIPGSVDIPASQLTLRLDELDPDAPTVVFCHFGMRSIAAASLLLERDFDEVYSLTGGIDLYAKDVATDLARY